MHRRDHDQGVLHTADYVPVKRTDLQAPYACRTSITVPLATGIATSRL
jgi:hypothetical protein